MPQLNTLEAITQKLESLTTTLIMKILPLLFSGAFIAQTPERKIPLCWHFAKDFQIIMWLFNE